VFRVLKWLLVIAALVVVAVFIVGFVGAATLGVTKSLVLLGRA
jgi:hypothetical protein